MSDKNEFKAVSMIDRKKRLLSQIFRTKALIFETNGGREVEYMDEETFIEVVSVIIASNNHKSAAVTFADAMVHVGRGE